MQPQDLALTMLGTYLRGADQQAWSGGMVALLGEFAFSVDASRAALNRLATRKLISRVQDGREVHYQLTTEAQRLLAEGDARIFAFGRSASALERWTVLWHSLPESRRTERTRLATRLRFLGFGSVQDATWVAPHDRQAEVLELLTGLGIADFAYLWVGAPARALDVKPVLEQAWNLEAVTARYRAFAEEFAPYRNARARQRLTSAEAFVVRTRAVHQFRRFPLLDPELPDEMMPEPRLRPSVITLFDRIYDGLADAAHRHFDEITRHVSDDAVSVG